MKNTVNEALSAYSKNILPSCSFFFPSFHAVMGIVSVGHPNAPLLPVGFWVWATCAGVGSGQEKEAILCKIKSTLSLASHLPSSNELIALGLEALEELEGLWRLGTWTIWDPDKIFSWRLSGEQLIFGTEMDPCAGNWELGERGERG